MKLNPVELNLVEPSLGKICKGSSFAEEFAERKSPVSIARRAFGLALEIKR